MNCLKQDSALCPPLRDTYFNVEPSVLPRTVLKQGHSMPGTCTAEVRHTKEPNGPPQPPLPCPSVKRLQKQHIKPPYGWHIEPPELVLYTRCAHELRNTEGSANRDYKQN